MAAMEISLTIKLDEDDWKAIERAIMTIEKRIERIEAILDARGLDWDHPRVEEEQLAEEPSLDGLPDLRTFAQPNLRWRILEPGEGVQEGDWYADASDPRRCWPPSKGAWLEVKVDSVKVGEVATSGLVFARLVSDEPAKEPVDHLAVPRMSPGEWVYIHEAYRDVTPADVGKLVIVRNDAKTPWIELRLAEVTGADFPYRCTKDGLDPTMWQAFRYARIWNERPANKAQPAWEPKVVDWVRVTRPERPEISDDTPWLAEMDRFDGKVMQVARFWEAYQPLAVILAGTNYAFKVDWLAPAEPPASDKPPEPEYREPVLPADACKECQFSDDGIEWRSGWLNGWVHRSHQWIWHSGGHWRHCRIKKDA